MSGNRPLRYSIRGRAALLTSVLVAVALAAFTWLTVARVRADLVRRGIERAATTASTLATQTSQTTQQGLTRLNQVASGPAVLSFLREPNDQTRAALLAAARSPAQAQEETVSIWDGAGRRLLDAPVGTQDSRTIRAEDGPPSGAGVTPLLTHGDVLFTRSAAEIPAAPNVPGQWPGYLVISRAVRATASSNVVNRMVEDASIVVLLHWFECVTRKCCQRMSAVDLEMLLAESTSGTRLEIAFKSSGTNRISEVHAHDERPRTVPQRVPTRPTVMPPKAAMNVTGSPHIVTVGA